MNTIISDANKVSFFHLLRLCSLITVLEFPPTYSILSVSLSVLLTMCCGVLVALSPLIACQNMDNGKGGWPVLAMPTGNGSEHCSQNLTPLNSVGQTPRQQTTVRWRMTHIYGQWYSNALSPSLPSIIVGCINNALSLLFKWYKSLAGWNVIYTKLLLFRILIQK